MKDLCIVITTDYEKTTHSHLAEETIADLETIHKTLETTHDIREFKLKPKSGSGIVNRVVEDILKASKSYRGCHIIINSHGSRTGLDLPFNVVLRAVENLSIPVTQLSALSCSAMTGQTIDDVQQSLLDSGKTTVLNLIAEGITKAPEVKLSNMERLKIKLEHLNSPITQSFKIWGPNSGYSAANTMLVQDILKHIESQDNSSLVVSITPKELFDAQKIQEIKEAITNIKSPHLLTSTLDVHITPKELFDAQKIQEIKEAITDIKSPRNRDRDMNLLGELLTHMYEKLIESLETNSKDIPGKKGIFDAKEHIPKELIALYSALETYSKENKLFMNDLLGVRRVYKQWKQKVKITSAERLKLLETYIDSIGVSSAGLNVAKCSSLGIFGGRGADDEKVKNPKTQCHYPFLRKNHSINLAHKNET